MTNGETLVVRAAMKPIPTLMTPLRTRRHRHARGRRRVAGSAPTSARCPRRRSSRRPRSRSCSPTRTARQVRRRLPRRHARGARRVPGAARREPRLPRRLHGSGQVHGRPPRRRPSRPALRRPRRARSSEREGASVADDLRRARRGGVPLRGARRARRSLGRVPDASSRAAAASCSRDREPARCSRRSGTVVYLAVTAEEALARIGDAEGRPLLAGEAGALAATLLAARERPLRVGRRRHGRHVGRTPEEVADEVRARALAGERRRARAGRRARRRGAGSRPTTCVVGPGPARPDRRA